MHAVYVCRLIARNGQSRHVYTRSTNKFLENMWSKLFYARTWVHGEVMMRGNGVGGTGCWPLCKQIFFWYDNMVKIVW